MNIKKELNNVFILFTKGDYLKAKELNDKILQIEPNNVYALKYANILNSKIGNKNNKKVRTGGKVLKCPHCLAKISFSALNGEQREKIKNGNYNNLELKCPYCHTKFVLQKRKANSILGIKIGDIANIEGKKYRATGYVEYRGRWYENRYSGSTYYLEWILLGEDNSYYYFSEGKSYDEGEVEIEFELSKKIIPNFRIPTNFTEYSKVTVKSIYGENSKNYIVGENTELYDFSNSGKNYVKEIEGAGSQKEAGIYETRSISGNEAGNLFGKKVNITTSDLSYSSIGIIPKLIFASIFALFSINFIFEPIFNTILEKKQKIEISNLDKAKKVELKFKDSSIMEEKQTSSTRYDYGGVKTYYSKNIGLKFSVKNEEDKKIIEKIIELESKEKNENFGGYGSTKEYNMIKMFDGDLYKLK